MDYNRYASMFEFIVRSRNLTGLEGYLHMRYGSDESSKENKAQEEGVRKEGSQGRPL